MTWFTKIRSKTEKWRVERGFLMLALLAASACPHPPLPPTDAAEPADAKVRQDLWLPPDLLTTDGAIAADQAAVCPAGKIAFAQSDGCGNDGSNEFCIPKGDAATLMAVKRIAAAVTCGPGRCRAGCDPAAQQLCFFPTDAATCTSPHGALTDSAWAQHCELAALPAVPRIVHTIFE